MHITDNPRFKQFRALLRDQGITLQPWGPFEGNEVYGFNIVGSHPDAPKTALAVNYGEDGFGWFPESQSNRMSDDVAKLVGKAQ